MAEMRPGSGCCQARRRCSGMTHKVIGGSLQPAVRPSRLPDVGVGLARPAPPSALRYVFSPAPITSPASFLLFLLRVDAWVVWRVTLRVG